ncbi:MAG: carbohydrate binding domain-containing protein [Ruminococcus sp.]|nr:carbohydrate binding domain-containing protein [Ruminococcus sp.]
MNTFKRVVSGAVLSAVAMMSVGSVIPQANKNFVALEANAASSVNNPIIWSDVPDDDVIRVGDTYYMVSTTMYFSPGAPIMKSKDLANWEICNYVFDTYANGDVQNLKNGKHDYAHGQWATSLRYNKKNGKYYAFFGSYGSGKSYICSTDDIENGEWSRVELNGMYHDASILFDDDGRNYLVSGAGGTCSIKEFNSDMTGWKQGGMEKQLFKTNFNNLAGEGWHIQKINGYYYIFGIAWPSGHGRLEFVYRSKSLNGNWESKTILDSGLGTYGSGCAQGGIVDTPDGKWYGLLFQDHGAVGRIPVLVPVTWQNDWPMMGVNGKAPLTLDLGTSKGSDLAGDDSFDYKSNDLALEWSWNHNPDNTAWSVIEREGWLRLKNKSIASHLLNARNTLTMRTEGPACSSYIKLDTKNMKPGDYAGLSAFQLKYGCIGVHVNDDGSKKIYMSVNSGSDVATTSNKIVAEQNLSGDVVYVKVDFKFANVNSDGSSSNNIDKANFYYSYDGQNWTKLGQELSMSYDLKLFTGYRSGIYSYATKTTGGYADIDFFEYDRQSWNGCNGSKVLSGSAHVVEPDENGYFFHNTFENGTDSWSGRGSASVEKSSMSKYEGSNSLYCSGRESAWNGATRSLSSAAFKAGQEYSFSADVMYNEGSSDSTLFYLTLQYEDTTGTVAYDKIAKGTATKGKWLQLANKNYKLPEGSNYQFYIETDEGTDGFYVDEAIGAVAGTEIDGPAAPVVTTTTTEPPKVTTTTTKPVNVKYGDVNLDGSVSVADAVAILQYLGNKDKYSLSAEAKANADVYNNGDGITAYDALTIQKYDAGLVTKLPASYSAGGGGGSTAPQATTTTGKATTTTASTTTTVTTTTTVPAINAQNESFESGAGSWEGRGGAVVASENNHYYSGNNSVKVSGRSSAWNGISYELGSDFKAGGTYSFSAAVMQPSASAQEMKLQLQYKDASGEVNYANIAKATAESQKWTKLENTAYTIPDDATELVFYIESTEGTFSFYVDDVQFAAEGTPSKVTTGGGTVGEIKVSTFDYSPNLQYKAAPDSYFRQPANHGTVVKENYNGINGNKNMYVYLPYGYDKSKKYNVFYLMHGGGESEETYFNDDAINIDIMLDNMIANGDIEPMIVVTPTFNKAPSADGVWEEMRKSIIPYVEGKYSTYANGNTSVDGLRASRYHRAYGGFSMGGGSTWANFNNNLDIIAYFMPLSGHCWDGAGKVLGSARNSGFKQDEYFVLAATGTKDLAYDNMVPMINELKKNTDVFTYTSDFSQGNLYFLEAPGNVHWWPQVRHYIYDGLPYFFHEHQD